MYITEPSTPDEYQHYYELRWKILRAPWGKRSGSEQDGLEDTSTHLMAVDDDNNILGVGRLHFNSIQEAQIRYMAVAGAHQRTGIGTLLLNALELKAAALGATRVSIEARETALGFYRKHGYGPAGPGHVLYNTIAHIKMTKNIDLQEWPKVRRLHREATLGHGHYRPCVEIADAIRSYIKYIHRRSGSHPRS